MREDFKRDLFWNRVWDRLDLSLAESRDRLFFFK